jgi:FKBP12-rapamycin complex-associated protein
MAHVNRGAASTSRGDTLSHFLHDLRDRDEKVRKKAARDLRVYVEGEAREISSESFTKVMNDLNRRIFDLVNSSDVHCKMGGISIIDELIDVTYEENDTKIFRFANYLRMVFQQSTKVATAADERLLQMASKALGHLARAGGTLTADIVEFEVGSSLDSIPCFFLERTRTSTHTLTRNLTTPKLCTCEHCR